MTLVILAIAGVILDDPSTKTLSSSVNVLIYIRIHTKIYYDETTSEETVFFLSAGFSQNILKRNSIVCILHAHLFDTLQIYTFEIL